LFAAPGGSQVMKTEMHIFLIIMKSKVKNSLCWLF